MVMERTSITRALAPLERDGLFHIRAGSDKRTRITHKEGRKTNRQRQAQFGRSPEDTTEPHWRSALDGDARSFEGYNAPGAPHTRGCKLTRYFEWRAGELLARLSFERLAQLKYGDPNWNYNDLAHWNCAELPKNSDEER
jgi:hypothetical protein